MPALVVLPKVGMPLQGRGRPQYGRNGKSSRSMRQAVLGGGGGIHAHVITKDVEVAKDFDGLVPFDDHPKDEGVAKREMSDAELSHRKKLNATGALVTSTLGLSALGSKLGGGALRKLGKAPNAARRMKSAVEPIMVSSGGIGGLSGYNYASVQRAEANRRKPPMVIRKAYDPENQRRRRNERQVSGLHTASRYAGIGGAAAGAGAAGTAGVMSVGSGASRAGRAMAPKGALYRRTPTKLKTMDPITGAKSKVHDPKAARDLHLNRMAAGRGALDKTKLAKLPHWSHKGGKLAVGLGAAGAGLGLASAGLHTGSSHWDNYTARHASTHQPRYRPPR